MVEKSTEPGNSDKPPSLNEWLHKHYRYWIGKSRKPWTPLRCEGCGELLRNHRGNDTCRTKKNER